MDIIPSQLFISYLPRNDLIETHFGLSYQLSPAAARELTVVVNNSDLDKVNGQLIN